jgi:hypothetical protein
MNKITLALLLALSLALMAGCSSVTPNYDAKFGDAVRAALVAQTLNPDAGKIPDQVAGMDGKASRETMLNYQSTFKEPPPVVNVINIGGSIGSGGTGGK